MPYKLAFMTVGILREPIGHEQVRDVWIKLLECIERWMRVTASMSGQCAMWGPGCTRGVRSRCRSCDKSGGLAFFVEIAEVGILVSHVSNGGRHGAPTSWQEIQTSTLLFPIHREENVR